jgi:hypothetical protein
MRLLPLDVEQMKKVADGMWQEARQIKYNSMKIGWYMRGSISYNDILCMSRDEIDDLNKIIEGNLETTKKTQMPFF